LLSFIPLIFILIYYCVCSLAHTFAKYNATPAAYIACGCAASFLLHIPIPTICMYCMYVCVRLVCITLAQYFILFMWNSTRTGVPRVLYYITCRVRVCDAVSEIRFALFYLTSFFCFLSPPLRFHSIRPECREDYVSSKTCMAYQYIISSSTSRRLVVICLKCRVYLIRRCLMPIYSVAQTFAESLMDQHSYGSVSYR